MCAGFSAWACTHLQRSFLWLWLKSAHTSKSSPRICVCLNPLGCFCICTCVTVMGLQLCAHAWLPMKAAAPWYSGQTLHCMHTHTQTILTIILLLHDNQFLYHSPARWYICCTFVFLFLCKPAMECKYTTKYLLVKFPVLSSRFRLIKTWLYND